MKQGAWLGVGLLCLLVTGCSTQAAPTGRGLYYRYDQETLLEQGYPDQQHQRWFWPGGQEGSWGLLHDDAGVPYGPNSYYHWDVSQNHPHFSESEASILGRWFEIEVPPDAPVWQYAHLMELLDLNHYELAGLLDFKPEGRAYVVCPTTMDDYTTVAGVDFWVTGVSEGSLLYIEPFEILQRRTLEGHATRNVVALSLLDRMSKGRLPQWFRNGVASYVSEEGNELLNYVIVYRDFRDSILLSPVELEPHLDPLVDKELGRIALYSSFLMVWRAAETWGFDAIRDVLQAVKDGASFEASVEKVYEMDYSAFLQALDPTVHGEPILEPRFPWRDQEN